MKNQNLKEQTGKTVMRQLCFLGRKNELVDLDLVHQMPSIAILGINVLCLFVSPWFFFFFLRTNLSMFFIKVIFTDLAWRSYLGQLWSSGSVGAKRKSLVSGLSGSFSRQLQNIIIPHVLLMLKKYPLNRHHFRREGKICPKLIPKTVEY